MSKIFNKSKMIEFSAYFEKSENFELQFGRYSIINKKLKPAKKPVHFSLAGNGGIPLGLCEDSEFISIDQTDSHTLIIGPTGSKKTRLIAMPTVKILSCAKESMIIIDPKAEIYKRTSDNLKTNGYKIHMLNLRSPEIGSSWNPLAIPYILYCKGEIDKACEFANDIAENLTHLEASKSDPFWDNSAGSLFFGLTMLLFKYCKEFNEPVTSVHIGNIIRLRNILLSGNIIEQRKTELWKFIKEDDFINTALSGTIEAPNDTRQSILSVFDEKMRTFSFQPNLLNLLASNDITFDNLMNEPTAIFLILPDEKTSYHRLVSLFVKQSYEFIINKAQQKLDNNLQYIRLNYILDEFSSLPTIRDFPAMITAARSRNIRFNIIIQSKHQLMLRYAEETDTIISNCNNWIFLASRELKFLEEVSSLCGSYKIGGISQPLLSVSELQRLDKELGEALILSGRMYPYITKLPDIDKYDSEKIHEAPLRQTRILTQANMLSFEKLNYIKNNPTQFMQQRPIVDIDNLIKNTALNLLELEEEKKENLVSVNKEMETIDKKDEDK